MVAVVDPGVGTARRAVALRAAEPTLSFVGPDNGLLPSGRRRAWRGGVGRRTGQPRYQLASPGARPSPGETFLPRRRHIWLPAVDSETSGAQSTPGRWYGSRYPVCRRQTDGSLEVEVTWVDRYGNVQLAAGLDALDGPQPPTWPRPEAIRAEGRNGDRGGPPASR